MSAASQNFSYRASSDGPTPDGNCKLIPFPVTRRRRFIKKTVARLLGAPAKTTERLLAATLERQARVMARKGVPPDLIELERRKLECAIRAELWRQVLLPDDAA